jgi:hypothetical protein
MMGNATTLNPARTMIGCRHNSVPVLKISKTIVSSGCSAIMITLTEESLRAKNQIFKSSTAHLWSRGTSSLRVPPRPAGAGASRYVFTGRPASPPPPPPPTPTPPHQQLGHAGWMLAVAQHTLVSSGREKKTTIAEGIEIRCWKAEFFRGGKRRRLQSLSEQGCLVSCTEA